MDEGIKIYVALEEELNQFSIMVVDHDKPLFAKLVTQPYLHATITNLKNDFNNTNRQVSVFYGY